MKEETKKDKKGRRIRREPMKEFLCSTSYQVRWAKEVKSYHCLSDCIRFANLALLQTKKNQILYRIELELNLPEMILNFLSLMLHLSRWMFHPLNLFNINITDFASDFLHLIQCFGLWKLYQKQKIWF